MYNEVNNQETLNKALKLCKKNSVYQQAILLGIHAISGATLKGKAKNYSDRYKKSANSIIQKCQENGLDVKVKVKKFGKRVVVIN